MKFSEQEDLDICINNSFAEIIATNGEGILPDRCKSQDIRTLSPSEKLKLFDELDALEADLRSLNFLS